MLAAAAAHECMHVLYVACKPPLLVSLIFLLFMDEDSYMFVHE